MILVLNRSLMGLRALIDRSIAEVRLPQAARHREQFHVSGLAADQDQYAGEERQHRRDGQWHSECHQACQSHHNEVDCQHDHACTARR